MKRFLNKSIAVLLAFVMLISFAPLTKNSNLTLSAQAAGAGVQAKLNTLRSKYPHGYFWNHKVTANSNNGDKLFENGDESFAETVTQSPCATHNSVASVGQYDCNYFDGGIQCFGFAGKIFYDIFGQRKSTLTKVYNNNDGVAIGDYVRINNNTHSAVVISRDSSTITVVECNLSGDGNASLNCKIRWDKTYNISSITYYIHATNYNQIDNANYFKNISSSEITQTSAKIEASIAGMTIQTAGFYLGTTKDNMTKKITEQVNKYTILIWYVIETDYQKLQPGTTYYYKFYLTVDGKEYCSDVKSFKTLEPTPATYSIKFDGNGATSGSMSNLAMTYGTAKALTANTFTKTGYTFSGWNTKADGSGTSYADKATVNNLTSTNGATVTLYAQWKAKYIVDIYVAAAPDKTVYNTGEPFDPTGLIIKATYDDGTEETLDAEHWGMICPDNYINTVGTHEIIVTTDLTDATTSFTITVIEREVDTNAPQLIMSTATARAGDQVDVTVEIKNNPGIIATSLNISYDTTALTLINVTDGGLLGNGTMVSGKDLTQVPYTVFWEDALAEENYTEDGIIVTLTFELSEDAALGTLPITLNYVQNSTFDVEINEVEFEVVSGGIEVTDRLPGDSNEDGVVDLKDVVILRRWLAGGWDVTVDEKNSDVNGDNIADLKDVVLMRRFLSGGWDVVLQ